MNNHNTKHKYDRLGFTVAELLVVVAIIAVLVGISIPIFANQKEKAANTVDVNNAKEIARQLEYYYMTNPDAVTRLLAIEQESTGSMQVIVTPQGMTFSTHYNNSGYDYNSTPGDKLVGADMKQIFGDPDSTTLKGNNGKLYELYNDYKCQSTKTWKQYAVVISCYNKATGKATSYPNIYYCAWDAAAYDGGYKWDNVVLKSAANNAFKNACGGDRIIE